MVLSHLRTYYKAKETYCKVKETYYKAKETYYKAKEHVMVLSHLRTLMVLSIGTHSIVVREHIL